METLSFNKLIAIDNEFLIEVCKIRCGAEGCKFVVLSAAVPPVGGGSVFRCAKNSKFHLAIEIHSKGSGGDNCPGMLRAN